MENWREKFRLHEIGATAELEPLAEKLEELLAVGITQANLGKSRTDNLLLFAEIVLRQKDDSIRLYREYEMASLKDDSHELNRALMTERTAHRKIRHILTEKAIDISRKLWEIENQFPEEIRKVFSRFYQAKNHLQMTDIIGMHESSLTVEFREKYIKMHGAEQYAERIKQMKLWLGID